MAESREILAIEIREDGSLVCKRNIESIGDSAGKTQSAVDALSLAMSTYASGVTLRGIMALTDEFISAQNAIRVLYGEGKNLNVINSELLRIANESRVSLNDAYESFNKLTLGTKEMGLSEKKVMETTEALTLALSPFGSSSSQAASAIQQFSMAMATGGPGGVAFRSMLRQASEAMLILGEYTGKSRSELKAAVADGTLSSEVIVAGLTAGIDQLREKVALTNYTFGQSMIVIKNSTEVALGSLNEMTGAGNLLHTVMMLLTSDQAVFTGATAALVTVLGSVGLVLIIAGVIAGFTALLGILATATSALLGITIAAGPLMLVLLGIGAAVGAAVWAYKEFHTSQEQLSNDVEKEKALTKIQVDLKEKLVGSIEKLKLENAGLARLYEEGSISLQKYNAELAKNEVDKYAQAVDRASGALRAMAKLQADAANESTAGAAAITRIWGATAKYNQLVQEGVQIEEERERSGGNVGQIDYGAVRLQNRIDQLEALHREIDAVEIALLHKNAGFGTSPNMFALTTQETQQSTAGLMTNEELANRQEINQHLLEVGVLNAEQAHRRELALFGQYAGQFLDANNGFDAAMAQVERDRMDRAKAVGEAVAAVYGTVMTPEQFRANMEAFDRLISENPGDKMRIQFLQAGTTIAYYGNSLTEVGGRIRAVYKDQQDWMNASAVSEPAATHARDTLAKATWQAEIQQRTYNAALQDGVIGLGEYTRLMLESKLAALQKDTTFQGGYARGTIESTQARLDEQTKTAEAARSGLLDNVAKAERVATIQQQVYTQALNDGVITLKEYNKVMVASQIAMLDQETDTVAGFKRGFLRVGNDIRDFASTSEKVVTDAFGNMNDALVSFVKTGKLDFSSLVDSMLEDMTRLLLKQAESKLFGGMGGGSSGLLGAAASGIMSLFSGAAGGMGGLTNAGSGGGALDMTAIAGRAGGGDVYPGSAYWVGERRPEIFVPRQAGTILPNAGSSSPAQVKVVNVHDPKDAVSAMNSAAGEQVILNTIRRNRTALQRELS
jgi:lambda family phage tail tape measure protein